MTRTNPYHLSTADPEACYGCGTLPGDGLTAGCNDPDGCGYFRAMNEMYAAEDGEDIENDPLEAPSIGHDGIRVPSARETRLTEHEFFIVTGASETHDPNSCELCAKGEASK